MPQEITFNRQEIGTPRVQSVEPVGLRREAQGYKELGNYFDEQVDRSNKLAIVEYQNLSIQSINDAYRRNSNNPDQLQKELDVIGKNLLKKAPGMIRAQVTSDFNTLAVNKIEKARSAKNKIDDSNLEFNVMQLEQQLIAGVTDNVDNFFVFDDTMSPAERQARASAGLGAISQSYEKLDRLYQTTKSDGTPLFSADKRFKSVNGLMELASSDIAEKYAQANPDRLKAFHDISNNELEIEIQDEQGNPIKINVMKALPPLVRDKVTKNTTKYIKDELSIASSLNAAQDRVKKQNGDLAKINITRDAQDGKLNDPAAQKQTLDALDNLAAKDLIDPDNYLDSREIVKNPFAKVTTDYRYALELETRMENGESVGEEMRSAFKEGKLGLNEFQKLADLQRSRTGGGKDYISEAETGLVRALGGFNAEIKEDQAAAIFGARNSFQQKIEEFVATNERKPSGVEIRQISQSVFDDYVPQRKDTIIGRLPNLQYSPTTKDDLLSPKTDKTVALQTFQKANQETVAGIIKRLKITNKVLTQDDKDKIAKDPEMKKLNQYKKALEDLYGR